MRINALMFDNYVLFGPNILPFVRFFVQYRSDIIGSAVGSFDFNVCKFSLKSIGT